MTLLQSYLSFFQEICEGRRAAPRGFALPEGGVEARAGGVRPGGIDDALPPQIDCMRPPSTAIDWPST